MNDVNKVTLTEQELSNLSHLRMNMEYLEQRASRCDSLVDIFAEALESMHRNDTQPVDGATFGNVAEVIREYSVAVKSGVINAHNALSQFLGKDGECDE